MAGEAVGGRRCLLKEVELRAWLSASFSHYLSSYPGGFTAISLIYQREKLSPKNWSCPTPGNVQGQGLKQPGIVEGVPEGWNKMGFKVPSDSNSMIL